MTPRSLIERGYSLIRRPTWPSDQSLAPNLDPPLGVGVLYLGIQVEDERFAFDPDEDGWLPYNG